MSDSEKLELLRRLLAAGSMIYIGGILFWSPISVQAEYLEQVREAFGPAWKEGPSL